MSPLVRVLRSGFSSAHKVLKMLNLWARGRVSILAGEVDEDVEGDGSKGIKEIKKITRG